MTPPQLDPAPRCVICGSDIDTTSSDHFRGVAAEVAARYMQAWRYEDSFSAICSTARTRRPASENR